VKYDRHVFYEILPELMIVWSGDSYLGGEADAPGLVFFILLSFSTGKAFFLLTFSGLWSVFPHEFLPVSWGKCPRCLSQLFSTPGERERWDTGQKEATWFRSTAAKSNSTRSSPDNLSAASSCIAFVVDLIAVKIL